MASAVAKASYYNDIWQNFYDTLKNDVVDQSVSDAHGTSFTLSNSSGSFPDTAIDKKSTYPIMIVEPPILSTDDFTLEKSEVSGTISISIYTTNAEAGSKFMNKIVDSVETSKGDLADNGIHRVNLETTDYDQAQRSQIKVHVHTATFRFVYRYTKTRSY